MSKKKTTARHVKKNKGLKRNCDLSDPELLRKPIDGHGFIYRYTFNDGRMYIGQTITSVKKRLLGHNIKGNLVDDYIRSGAHFNIDILAEVPLEILDRAERFCICEFESLYPDGFNLSIGGQEQYRTYAPAVRERLSKKRKEVYANQTDDKKKKQLYQLSKARDVHFKKFRRKIICLETGEVFNSLKEAGDSVGASSANIKAALIGERSNTVRGFHFILWTQYIQNNREEVIEVLDRWSKEKNIFRSKQAARALHRERIKNGEPCYNSRSIVCLDNGTRYESCEEAGRQLGISGHNVYKVVTGLRMVTLGYHFIYECEYAYEDPKGIIDSFEEYRSMMKSGSFKNKTSSIPVRCIETGKIYHSSEEAGRSIGRTGSMIRGQIAGKYEHVKGYHFENVMLQTI